MSRPEAELVTGWLCTAGVSSLEDRLGKPRPFGQKIFPNGLWCARQRRDRDDADDERGNGCEQAEGRRRALPAGKASAAVTGEDRAAASPVTARMSSAQRGGVLARGRWPSSKPGCAPRRRPPRCGRRTRWWRRQPGRVRWNCSPRRRAPASCYQRIRRAGVTLIWRGSRPRTDTIHCPISAHTPQRRIEYMGRPLSGPLILALSCGNFRFRAGGNGGRPGRLSSFSHAAELCEVFYKVKAEVRPPEMPVNCMRVPDMALQKVGDHACGRTCRPGPVTRWRKA
jgi:hypothetical protein